MTARDMALDDPGQASVVLRRGGVELVRFLSHVDIDRERAAGWSVTVIADGGARAKSAMVEAIKRMRLAN